MPDYFRNGLCRSRRIERNGRYCLGRSYRLSLQGYRRLQAISPNRRPQGKMHAFSCQFGGDGCSNPPVGAGYRCNLSSQF